MQRLETLWNLVNAVGTVRDLASDSKQYNYLVPTPTTLYLHTQTSHITLKRTAERHIKIAITLQPAFGWRIHTEQDEAGVYVVARPRQALTSITQAHFDITTPQDTYCIIKGDACQLTLANIHQTLHIQPDDTMLLK